MRKLVNMIISYWKNKVRIIENLQIFKLFIGIAGIVFALFVGGLEALLLLQENLVALIILITLIIQYNRPTIVMHLTEKKKSMFLISKSKTYLRFCFFQILKYNCMLPIFFVVTILLTPAFLFLNGIGILLTWMVIFVELAINAFAIRYQLRNRYEDKYKRKSENQWKHLNIKKQNMIYFSRVPIKEYLELIVQLTVLIISAQFVSGIIVNYILLVFMVVDIEILEDYKMENYANHYGKYAVKKIAQIGKLACFRLSEEYKLFLKYLLLQIAVIIYGGPKQLVFSVLMLAVSYRYYCGIDKLFGERTLFKYTWFRMCMLYLIILALAPFLFEEELKSIAGYQPLYGYLFLAGMSVVSLIVPFEKVISMSGESVDEN